MKLALLAALLMVASGCSSKYIPHSRGRVSTVMVGGQIQYVRDGQMTPHGFLGSGLQTAVRGNPAAERAARTYYTRQRNGLLMSLGGLVCGVASLTYAGVQAAEEGGGDHLALPVTAAIGCLVVSYAGLFVVASAAPYQLDAINLFNDAPGPCRNGPPGNFAAAENEATPCPGAEVARETTALRLGE